MTAMGRGLDKLLLGHGSADAEWWQVRIRSTGQRKDAMVDPSTGQIGESLPPAVILTIPAGPWPPNTLSETVLIKDVGIGGAGVLTVAIGMMDEAWQRSSARQRQLQRRGGKVSPQMIGDCPADDLVGEGIEDDRQVQPALPGADVRDVGHPDLVWRHRTELSLHQVLHLRRRIWNRCASKSSGAPANQLGPTNQTSDTFSRDASAALAQLGTHTRRTVRAAAVIVDVFDLIGEQFDRPVPGRCSLVLPGVERALGHAQHATQQNDRMMRLLLRDVALSREVPRVAPLHWTGIRTPLTAGCHWSIWQPQRRSYRSVRSNNWALWRYWSRTVSVPAGAKSARWPLSSVAATSTANVWPANWWFRISGIVSVTDCPVGPLPTTAACERSTRTP
jgi:hypothetical protein